MTPNEAFALLVSLVSLTFGSDTSVSSTQTRLIYTINQIAGQLGIAYFHSGMSFENAVNNLYGSGLAFLNAQVVWPRDTSWPAPTTTDISRLIDLPNPPSSSSRPILSQAVSP